MILLTLDRVFGADWVGMRVYKTANSFIEVSTTHKRAKSWEWIGGYKIPFSTNLWEPVEIPPQFSTVRPLSVHIKAPQFVSWANSRIYSFRINPPQDHTLDSSDLWWLYDLLLISSPANQWWFGAATITNSVGLSIENRWRCCWWSFLIWLRRTLLTISGTAGRTSATSINQRATLANGKLTRQSIMVSSGQTDPHLSLLRRIWNPLIVILFESKDSV